MFGHENALDSFTIDVQRPMTLLLFPLRVAQVMAFRALSNSMPSKRSVILDSPYDLDEILNLCTSLNIFRLRVI